MFDSNDKLDIFENFRVDRNLPKHSKNKDEIEMGRYLGVGVPNTDNFSISNPHEYEDDKYFWTEVPGLRHKRPKNWWQRLKWKLRRKPKTPKPKTTVEQFFASVHNSTQELEVVQQRAQGYRQAMAKALSAGQTALFEQLTLGLEAARAEAQLVAAGRYTYIDEGTLVEFVKKAPKGLRLDWVANFTRDIPAFVLQKKMELDTKEVFDNYVVLHYDPEGKSWAETQKEKEARKDPILFGVLQGKRRLYFVGDWVDEFCDLTLDQIADSVGVLDLKEKQ